jgi:hypothetical protein
MCRLDARFTASGYCLMKFWYRSRTLVKRISLAFCCEMTSIISNVRLYNFCNGNELAQIR